MNAKLVAFILTDEHFGLVNLLPFTKGHFGEDRAPKVEAAIARVIDAMNSGIEDHALQSELSDLFGFAMSFGVGAGMPSSIAAAAYLALRNDKSLPAYAARIWGTHAAHIARSKAWARHDPEAAHVFNVVWQWQEEAMLAFYRELETQD